MGEKHFLTLQRPFKILSWLVFSKWINKIKCHISSRGAPVTGRSCAFSRSIAAPSLLQGPRLIMMLMRISWRESRMGGFLGKHDFGRKIHAQSWAWIGAAAQFLNWNQSLIISQSSARIPAPEWKILISWALSHLPALISQLLSVMGTHGVGYEGSHGDSQGVGHGIGTWISPIRPIIELLLGGEGFSSESKKQ